MDRSASLGDGRDTRENKRKLSAIVKVVVIVVYTEIKRKLIRVIASC